MHTNSKAVCIVQDFLRPASGIHKTIDVQGGILLPGHCIMTGAQLSGYEMPINKCFVSSFFGFSKRPKQKIASKHLHCMILKQFKASFGMNSRLQKRTSPMRLLQTSLAVCLSFNLFPLNSIQLVGTRIKVYTGLQTPLVIELFGPHRIGWIHVWKLRKPNKNLFLGLTRR